MRHTLTQLDLSGTPAYLEVSSPRSRALYHRLGFTDLDQPVTLPGGPDLYPMWRPAGAPLTTGHVANTDVAVPTGSAVDGHHKRSVNAPNPMSDGGTSGSCLDLDRQSPPRMDWVNQRRYDT